MAFTRSLWGLFRGLFASGATLVSGEDPVAATLCERLRRDGRAVRRLGQGGLTASQLRRAETLVLADPADPVAAVTAVFDLAAGRSTRGAPLRLILAHRGPWPEGLPGPEAEGPVRLEGLALEVEAARALLAAHPLHSGCDPLYGQVPHLLIAGTDPPALELLVQAMRLGHYGPDQAVFTLAADPPDAWRNAVLSAYPQAPQCCRLRFTGLAEPDLDGAPPVTGVWVLLDPPESGLDLAQTLAARLLAAQGVAPPIYLEVGRGPSPAGTSPTGTVRPCPSPGSPPPAIRAPSSTGAMTAWPWSSMTITATASRPRGATPAPSPPGGPGRAWPAPTATPPATRPTISGPSSPQRTAAPCPWTRPGVRPTPSPLWRWSAWRRSSTAAGPPIATSPAGPMLRCGTTAGAITPSSSPMQT